MTRKTSILNDGIQFKKLDLHTHTYRSYGDFEREGVSDKDFSKIAERICNDAKAKGLNGIAITDHNNGEAIDEIRAADKRLGTNLAIIAGVEVDVHEGMHVICLFPNKTTSANVRDWLIRAGVDSTNMGQSNFTPSTKTTLESIRHLIDEAEGVMIAAHSDASSQGLFSAKKVGGSKHIKSLMEAAHFDAIETKNIERLKREYAQFIEGYALYQASDNHLVKPDGSEGGHHSSAIGNLYTWFKLDEITVEGLRQCFIDPDVRIKQMDEWKSEMITGTPRLLSIEIKGRQGFFADGQIFTFNTDINSFLGGKGAGKSLVLEYIRFVLDDLSVDEFIQYDCINKLIKNLRTGGKVSVNVQTERGDIYVITREFDPTRLSDSVASGKQKLAPDLCKRILASSPILVASQDGTAKPNLDAKQLFPIVAYSQTEIFTLARDKSSQLALLDKYIDKTGFQTTEAELVEKIEKNDTELLKALQAQWGLIELTKRYTTLKEKLDAKTKQAQNPKYEASAKVNDSYDVAQGVIAELLGMKSGVLQSLEDQATILQEEIAKYNPKERNPAKTKLQSLSKLIKGFISQEQNYKKKVDASQAKVDKEFEEFKKKHKRFLDKNSIEITLEERTEVRQAQERVQKATALAKRYAGLFSERETSLTQLTKLRSDFTQERKAKYTALSEKSADRLQLSLIEEDDKSLFRGKLKELLARSGTKPETYIDALIERNTPRELVNKILGDKVEDLKKDIGKNTTVDCERVVAHLKGKIAELLPLEYEWTYADEPKIELNVRASSSEPDEYKGLDQLSAGQKSTALLIISLLEGNRPILIDQPEDALDLKSVIQDVSKRLRQYKTKRQFIITTHNSSVAVSSDSDKYFVLEPDGDSGRLLFSGAIDTPAIREEIIIYLEGGSRSYELKRKKYKK